MTNIKSTCCVLLMATGFPVTLLLMLKFRPGYLESANKAGLLIHLLMYLWAMYEIVIPFFTSPLRKLPSPPGASFLLGHGMTIVDRPPGNLFLHWMKTVPNKGFIYFLSFAQWGYEVLPTTPEILMEVLNTKSYEFDKPVPVKRFLARVIGRGLIIVDGQEHKMQRKSVAVAFQGKHIKELVPTFWEKSIALTEVISADIPKTSGPVEITNYASRITLDIIGVAGLGREFNAINNAEDELVVQYESILNPKKGNVAVYFAVNMLIPQWIVRWIPWRMNQVVAAATVNLRRICERLVKEKKASLEKHDAGAIDILSVLIRSNSFDDTGLVDQLLTFLAAGHETTSAALTWATYLLSTHPTVQERLRSEVREHLQQLGPDERVTAATIDSMPLLHAVCSETLRLYSTVPITSRVAHRTTTIANQVIPKGTEIIICPWAINRLPQLWGPDAEEFKPDRWLGSEKNSSTGGAANQYSFLTFLHGPRSCIGQGFARAELKCLLAAMVNTFSMELEDKNYVPMPAGAVTIKPEKGMPLILTKLRD